jgi:hypothetical protein
VSKAQAGLCGDEVRNDPGTVPWEHAVHSEPEDYPRKPEGADDIWWTGGGST